MTALYALTPEQHATVLAALRYYQRDLLTMRTGGAVYDLATMHGSVTPLTIPEIDDLSVRLNHRGLTFAEVVLILGTSDDPYAIAAQDLVCEGELEVDLPTIVSESDEGAYVMGWIWVSAEAAGIEIAEDED